MRRRLPEVVVGLLLVLLLASYIAFSQNLVRDLRHEAMRSSQMYARIFRAFGDTSAGVGPLTLLALAGNIREQGIPLVVTDLKGNLTGQHANIPGSVDSTSAEQMKAYVRELDKENKPVV